MNAQQFFFLTKDVREAQKLYFQTRTTEALNKSKALEAQLDAEIEKTLIAKGLKEVPHTQTSLHFDNNSGAIPPQGWSPS